MMNPDQLYYVSQPGGAEQGPWKASDIIAMAQSGKLPSNSLVWTEGMAEWQPLSSLMGGAPAAPSGNWNPIVALKSCLKRYAVFSGRASRSEYWYFVLAEVLLYFAYQVICFIAGTLFEVADSSSSEEIALILILDSIFSLCCLALIIPGLAVTVRRLHDIGKSGWWIFIGLIPLVGPIWLLVLYCQDSAGQNQYGNAPDGPIA